MFKAITNDTALAELACRGAEKHGLYIGFAGPEVSMDERVKAAPYLKESPTLYVRMELHGNALLLFESESERDDYYWKTVGDDGPTKLNPYKGPAKVYALRIDRKGRPLGENT